MMKAVMELNKKESNRYIVNKNFKQKPRTKGIGISLIFIVLIISFLVINPSNSFSQTPELGGTLKVLSMLSPSNLGYPPTMRFGYIFTSPYLESILRMDTAGKPMPCLATSWKVGNGGKSLLINLKKKMSLLKNIKNKLMTFLDPLKLKKKKSLLKK